MRWQLLELYIYVKISVARHTMQKKISTYKVSLSIQGNGNPDFNSTACSNTYEQSTHTVLTKANELFFDQIHGVAGEQQTINHSLLSKTSITRANELFFKP